MTFLPHNHQQTPFCLSLWNKRAKQLLTHDSVKKNKPDREREMAREGDTETERDRDSLERDWQSQTDSELYYNYKDSTFRKCPILTLSLSNNISQSVLANLHTGDSTPYSSINDNSSTIWTEPIDTTVQQSCENLSENVTLFLASRDPVQCV